MNLKCPICDLALPTAIATAHCPNGHSFDRAKEGYWNLLPVQHKKSMDPGDNKQMLQARRRFLEAGHYAPLVNHLTQCLPDATSIVDIGCGEGYYARTIGAASGVDISKDGVRMAAKSDAQGLYAVGSAYRLPYQDETFDGAISVFSPLDWTECCRVLKPGSPVIWVAPLAGHLKELAAMVYDEVRPHSASPPDFGEICGTVTRESLQFTIELAGPQLSDLLCMTPYYWSASEQKQAAIAQAPMTQVSVEFEVWSARVPASASSAAASAALSSSSAAASSKASS